MVDVDKLISDFGKDEKKLQNQEILASYFPEDSSVAVRIKKILYKFKIAKRGSAGVGVFKPLSFKFAEFVRDASQEEVVNYFRLFPRVKAIVAFQTKYWYAFPANLTAYKKINFDGLFPLLMAEGIQQCDYVIASFDGLNLWFNEIDFRADVEKIENMRQVVKGKKGSIKGFSPEDKEVISLARKNKEEQEKLTLEGRLKHVFLERGAKLDGYTEHGNRIEIKWQSSSGEYYTTVADKDNLSVMSAGICLSGRDKDFDLQSLVGVISRGERKRAIVKMSSRDDEDDDW